jgi:hypothetical protein
MYIYSHFTKILLVLFGDKADEIKEGNNHQSYGFAKYKT